MPQPPSYAMGLVSKCSKLNKRRLIAPLFCHLPVTGRLILNVFAEKSSRISDLGGSNLDANSLQSGSVLDAIQQLVH